jgi:transcriptional regulator with XRE-family HTH domain
MNFLEKGDDRIDKPSGIMNRRRTRQHRRRFQEALVEAGTNLPAKPASEGFDVGHRLRELRIEADLSIRALAELSNLNVNTLSLIENGKSSPSVSTLQQLAKALEVPITAFFETETPPKSIVFQKSGHRTRADFSHGTLEDMSTGLAWRGGQPLLITLEPKADSGSTPIVHTGYEFVFCLEGYLQYTIEGQRYLLEPGDSLLFEAYLPHRWENVGEIASRSLLVLCPTDENDSPTKRHFAPE